MGDIGRLTLRPIATIENDFPTKFGVPRQSGIVDELRSRIVFLPEYRQAEAFRGLEDFSHLWLIWGFSEVKQKHWSATVRPPRLGGNKRMGVFATRSPFRPNPIGLSCVRLIEVCRDAQIGGVSLIVSGADLMNGTPIYDIKPYLPYADCKPDALGGFADTVRRDELAVVFPEELLGMVPAEKQASLTAILSSDPRPHYQNDPQRVYGFFFAGLEVKFRVCKKQLTVCDVQPVMAEGSAYPPDCSHPQSCPEPDQQ